MLRMIGSIAAIQVVAILASLVRSKMLAEFLGPEGVGIVSLVDQVTQLACYLSALSLPFAAVKFLSRSHSRSFEAFQKSYSSFLGALLVLTTTGAALTLAVVLLQPESLGPNLAEYRVYLVPALLGVTGMTLQGFFSSVLAAAQRARASAMMGLLIALCLAAAAFLGISLDGILGLYWANLLAGILIVGVLLAYLRRVLGLRFSLSLRRMKDSIGQEIAENPDIVTFSLIFYGTTLLYSGSYLVVRYSILASAGPAEAGLLQAAIALAGSVNLILNPANGLYLTPILNRQIPNADKVRAALAFQGKLTLAIAGLAVPLVLFPQWALTLLFSTSFLPVAQVVFVFVLAQAVTQLTGVNQALIIGLDNLKAYGVTAAAAHLSLAILAWLLAPRYGILGVALAFLASSLGNYLVTLAYLSLKHRLVISSRLASSIGFTLFAVLAAGVVGAYSSPWEPLTIMGRAALFTLLALAMLLLLPHEDRAELHRVGQRLLSRVNWPIWRSTLGQAYRWIARGF